MMDEKRQYRLTRPQKRIWYTEKTYPGTAFACLAFTVRYRRAVDPDTLEKAIISLISSNEGLRMRLSDSTAAGGGEDVQYVCAAAPEEIGREDFSGPGGRRKLGEWLERDASTPFALYDSPFYRFVIIDFGDDGTGLSRTGFYFKLHHMISDGWTAALVYNQVLENYEMIERDRGGDIKARPPYSAAIPEEDAYLSSPDFADDEKFWLGEMSEPLDDAAIHFKSTRAETIRAKRKLFVVPDDLRAAMHEYRKAENTSIFKLVTAALLIYISRCAGAADVAVTTATHNRHGAAGKLTAGMFVGTVPLRARITADSDFASVVSSSGSKLNLILKKHARYPFDELITRLREKKNPNADVLMNAISVVGHPDEDGERLFFRNHFQGYEPAPMTVHVNAHGLDAAGRLELFFDYQTDLFDDSDAEGVFNSMVCILRDGISNRSKKVFALEMISNYDRRRILGDFNSTREAYPKDKTIIDLFKEAAARYPSKTAIVDGDVRLSYSQLDRMSDSLAAALAQKGVGREKIVAIFAERSRLFVAAMLGVMKAGGAYLPIDVSYPADRIEFMLKDSGAGIVLTQKGLAEKLPADANARANAVLLDAPETFGAGEPVPPCAARPENMAYIIYTSGSTGRPKGVVIVHRAVTNIVTWNMRHYKTTCEDRCAQFASFAFDASVTQTFAPLCAGAELHILPDDARYSPAEANCYFEKNSITYADLPTQFCEQFAREVNNRSLRRVTTGGEKLKAIPATGFRLTDEYGPTECTVSATYYDVDGSYAKTPIGRPVANTRIYILDRNGAPTPVGVPGELCIAGDGLARGYLGRPDLTDEKFVADPFVPGERMYRSGDAARWLPDGNIDYVGRIDFQVKIRGFRIEPGEIDARLSAHADVRNSITVAKTGSDGEKYLCSYIESDRDIPCHEIRSFITSELPEYMVPARVVSMKRLPVNSSGKIDRRALPEPPAAETGGGGKDFARPEGETEEKLAAIWREVLAAGRVGACDDFMELGGHSLKAAALQSRIRKAFGVEISLKDIFEFPTVRLQAGIISRAAGREFSVIRPAGGREHYPLSAAQRRLFVIEQMGNAGTAYNLTSAFAVRGPLDLAKFGKAIERIVERHAALRTRFDSTDGEPVQIVEKKVFFKKIYVEAGESELDGILKNFVKPFDIRKAPLFRVMLVKYAPESHLFVFDAHHIIFDGVSLGVFMDELGLLYEGVNPAPAGLDYTDFAVWQNESTGYASAHEKCADFWLRSFSGEVPAIEIQTDLPRPAEASYEGGRVTLGGEDLSKALSSLTSACQATGFSALLAVFYVLLHKLSGQDDIVVGVPSSGRADQEFESTVGMFVNTLALRGGPQPAKVFREFVSEVKANFAAAFDNQRYQFDALVERLGLKRNSGRNPLFDFMFAFEEDPGALRAGPLEFRQFGFDPGIAKFDMTLFAVRSETGLELVLEYRSGIYERSTAERFVRRFAALLKRAAADPDVRIGDMSAMEEGEAESLLFGFNSTKASYPSDSTVTALFEKKAAERPDDVAISCGGSAMSYRELNEKANRLAWRLRESGSGPDAMTGILMDRSFKMVVSILAVLKSGGAYLPVDPSYPKERIAYLIEDSGIRTLLTQKKYSGAVAYSGALVDVFDESSYSGRTDNPPPVNSPDDVAYMIYTSGSTGKPKGVMVRHRGATNYICWCKKVYLGGGSGDFPLYSSISFDLTVTSIFTPLISGGRIVVYGEEEKASLIAKIIEDDLVDVVKLTPTHLQIIEGMDIKCKKIRKFIVGGEDLKSELAAAIAKKFPEGVEIFNEYGPTETTVGCMIYRFDPARAVRSSVPIGVPADNTMIYILGADLKPVPRGAKGEIYISGDGVARGYRNKPEMTAAKFVPDPFAPCATMYRSGDLARMLPDGNIEFLGRIDDQVKLRGFRIETGEIETELLRHPSVRDAVVMLRDDRTSGKYLCAYYTCEGDVGAEELKKHIAKKLPYYFVPDRFVKLDAIPVTPNGKADRKALPDPAENAGGGREYVEARNAVEERIAAVWRRVLGAKRVGIDDNFFEMGGHSLKAVKAAMELSKEFEITVNDIFETQTVRALAGKIRPARNNIRAKIASLRDYPGSPVPPAPPQNEDRDGDGFHRRSAEYERSVAGYSEMDLSESKEYGTILLAGATGYLGSYILRELLETRSERIALVVRAADDASALERAARKYDHYFGDGSFGRYAGRVEAYAGDLSKERLGLAPGDYERLRDSVGCILNSAANVRHFGHYQEFYDANVRSVENLSAFAADGKIKEFNHVSTMSVASGDIKGVKNFLFTESDMDVGQELTNYYLKTKLEGEKAAVAAREKGVTVNIFRAGNLTFDSKNHRGQENLEENAFYQIFRSLALIGAVPDSGDEAEFSYVDLAARAIVLLFSRKRLGDHVHHIVNGNTVKLSELLSSPDSGMDVEAMAFEKFARLMLSYLDDEAFKPMIENLLLHRDWVSDMESETAWFAKSSRTARILEKLGFAWPAPSPADCFEMAAAATAGRAEFLKGHPLFAGMEENALKTAALMTRETPYEDGAAITWEGEASSRTHIIAEGAVELSKHSKNSWLGTISVLGPNDLVACEAALTGGVSGVIAEAIMGRARTVSISNRNVAALAARYPRFGLNLAAEVSKKLVAMQNIMVNIG